MSHSQQLLFISFHVCQCSMSAINRIEIEIGLWIIIFFKIIFFFIFSRKAICLLMEDWIQHKWFILPLILSLWQIDCCAFIGSIKKNLFEHVMCVCVWCMCVHWILIELKVFDTWDPIKKKYLSSSNVVYWSHSQESIISMICFDKLNKKRRIQ